jgi:pyrimidine-nucleoside phosphorylase
MLPQWVIERKRDGHPLSEAEIRSFIEGFTRGAIPEYQMAALAMAIYFQGMNPQEVATLTDAMMRSGDLVDTSSIKAPKVDKHSTGGIGDKISLILAPLVACCGVAVPMISGRGLGITGGTLDKLEAIPGYRTNLSEKEFLKVVRACGCSIIGQTKQLAPADKKLYALRDVTATVPSIPLITASIMCKKLAEGIDALVLDVKCGSGAFMKTQKDARALAQSMVRVGRAMKKKVSALITDMNQPLGRAAGNAVEVVESVETLNGRGPRDLTDLTVAFGVEMLVLSGKARDRKEADQRLRRLLATGEAYARFKEMVRLHGGDPGSLDDARRLPTARTAKPFPAPRAGYIAGVDADAVGRAVLVLGAGRTRTDGEIDHAVGVTGLRKIGESVARGEPLLVLHANDKNLLREAERLLARAFTLSAARPRPPKLILETLR